VLRIETLKGFCKAMDESIQILKKAVQEARVEDKEKMRSLQRLRRFVPDDIAH